jgi:hypothetical protein
VTVGDSPYRILVTGWRHWPREAAWYVHRELHTTVAPLLGGVPIIVVDGWCPYGGVDLYAHEWAVSRYGEQASERHEAQWGPRGRLLGPERNTKMVNLGADICLAFPGPNSRGTVDCVNKAKAAGIFTMEFPWREEFRHGIRSSSQT